MTTIKDIFDNKYLIDHRNDVINFIKQFGNSYGFITNNNYEYENGDVLYALTDACPTPRDGIRIIDLNLSYRSNSGIEWYIYLFRNYDENY